METCYNTDPESLIIVETSRMGSKIFDTDKYEDVLENADIGNAQKSDTSNFSKLHFIIQRLHSVMRKILGHLCNFKLGLHIALHSFVDPSIRQIVCSAKCQVEVIVL